MTWSDTRAALTEHLKAEEGTVLHAYQDHLGFLTIGTGRLIDHRKGGGLSEAEAEYLLGNDIDRVAADLDRRLPWWREQPAPVQVALCSMAFQMGAAGLLAFRRMLAALERGDRAEAARQALDSKWARQTPARAERVAGMIRGA